MSDYAVMPKADYVEVCDTIREKIGTTDAIKSGELVSRVNEVYEAGKKVEHDAFWDAYQNNGSRTDYALAFANLNANWTDKSYNPKYPLKVTNASQMFQSCGVVDTKIECDFSKCTNFHWTFRNSQIKHIGVVDFSSCNIIDGTFTFLNNCTDIDEIICHENLALSQFSYSFKLVNVKFSGVIAKNGLDVGHSTALSHDSLMSVINCLKDYSKDTSGTSWAVTLGSANHSKLTNAEKAIATEKGWSLV